jgi:DNA-binding response OmpR family regulator
MTSRDRILLVEDDELIGTMVELNLEHARFEVVWARSAEDAQRHLDRGRFDAMLLDLMLPGMDGMQLAASLRRAGVTTPILMLTVRDDTRTKVAALEGGIDDYLAKPFDVEELVARVRALIRRGQSLAEIPATSRIAVAGGEVLLDSHQFRDRTGGLHDLSEKEAHLLALLARSAGRTLTRSDVIEEVWGMDAIPTERTVDNFILRLRRLVESDPERPSHIVTVRGRGYRWQP